MSNSCSITDKKFLSPCDSLKRFSHDKGRHPNSFGLYLGTVISAYTMKHVRTYLGLRSNEARSGIILNFCPFCGYNLTEITKPRQPEEMGIE